VFLYDIILFNSLLVSIILLKWDYLSNPRNKIYLGGTCNWQWWSTIDRCGYNDHRSWKCDQFTYKNRIGLEVRTCGTCVIGIFFWCHSWIKLYRIRTQTTKFFICCCRWWFKNMLPGTIYTELQSTNHRKHGCWNITVKYNLNMLRSFLF
jgi:hypothetical protein